VQAPPGPLPIGWGGGEFCVAARGTGGAWQFKSLPTLLPLPFGRGEGWGEGSAGDSVSAFTDRLLGETQTKAVS
jgi:hypothetical protein